MRHKKRSGHVVRVDVDTFTSLHVAHVRGSGRSSSAGPNPRGRKSPNGFLFVSFVFDVGAISVEGSCIC